MKRSGLTIVLMVGLLVGEIGRPAATQETFPNSTPNLDSRFEPIRFNAPDLTGEGRPTEGNTDTATRSICKISGSNVVPLVPAVPPSYLGLTDAKHPTFWFSIPFDDEDFDTLKFTLREMREDNTIVYEKLVKAPIALPGAIGISVPPTAPELEVGKIYDWSLEFYCTDPTASDNIVEVQPSATISGSILRKEIPPELARDLEEATTPRQRAIAYAGHGFWYDALAIVAGLHRNHPGNRVFSADWKNLLSDVQLGDVAEQPIVGCCFVEE